MAAFTLKPMHARRPLRWLAAVAFLLAPLAAPGQPALLQPQAHDRVLVVAPHPDDETLCCAGILQRARAAGAQVGIIWMTAGDGARFNAVLARITPRSTSGQMVRLGKRRIREATAAAGVLGVPDEAIWMLGYPDRGLARLLDPHSEEPFRSRYTRRQQIPYSRALSSDATITAARLHADLVQVIDGFQPTLVFAPAPQDVHPDHHATAVLVRQALAAAGSPARLASYIIHAGEHWPAPRGLRPHLPLRAATAVAGQDWLSFELTAEEQQRKVQALRQHRSQMRRMPRFLNAFVRRNELFTLEVQVADLHEELQAGAGAEES